MTQNTTRLTVKQQRFVDFFDGNAAEAARKAGYKKPAEQGYENLRKPHIQDAIEARETKRNSPVIMSREQRQAMWTEFAQDENKADRDRLRASELLGKSQADFIDRREHSVGKGASLTDLILAANSGGFGSMATEGRE